MNLDTEILDFSFGFYFQLLVFSPRKEAELCMAYAVDLEYNNRGSKDQMLNMDTSTIYFLFGPYFQFLLVVAHRLMVLVLVLVLDNRCRGRKDQMLNADANILYFSFGLHFQFLLPACVPGIERELPHHPFSVLQNHFRMANRLDDHWVTRG